jgi:undecaprenyl diphosphate synthase
MEELIKKTKKHNKGFLNFFIMYDGRIEMTEAVRRISELAKKDKNLKITVELVKEGLYTAELPFVDFVIRTGAEGDPHNSAGFMMWDTSYSQLYFTDVLWPDFGAEEFEKALRNYAGRERRRGI